MPVKLETVADALDNRNWAASADLAEQALAEGGPEGEWKKEQKAFLYFALCRSYSNMEKYSAALDPGQLAVYLAEDAREWDLLGRSLVELAWVQHKVPGIEWQAVHTLRRYLDCHQRYKGLARNYYLPAMHNLGVCLRAAGEHEQALEQFLKTYEAAKQRRDADQADMCRRNATWQALELRRTDLAEKLIAQGQDYVRRHPNDDRVNASHLIDEAQLSYLKGQYADATAIAIEAAIRAEHEPDMFAYAMNVLHRVGKATGEIEGALALALIAKNEAEKGERHDLVDEFRASIREMSLVHPEAVERFIKDCTRPT